MTLLVVLTALGSFAAGVTFGMWLLTRRLHFMLAHLGPAQLQALARRTSAVRALNDQPIEPAQESA